MRNFAVLVIIALFVASSSSEEPPILKGTVTDPLGAAIGDARIFMRAVETGGAKEIPQDQKELLLWTNEKGWFSARLTSAYYDVFVSGAGFSPQCRKIRVRDGKSTTVNFEMKLDPQVTAEFGTRVEATPH